MSGAKREHGFCLTTKLSEHTTISRSVSVSNEPSETLSNRSMKASLRKVGERFVLLSVLVVTAILAGCRGAVPEFTSKPDSAVFTGSDRSAATRDLVAGDPTPFRIQPGDLLALRSPDSVAPYQSRIKEDGTFTHPTLGTFVAAGKTEKELYEEIVARDPRYRGLPPCCNCEAIYYVTGAVKFPGLKPYLGSLTVWQAIESAGGFTKAADTSRLSLLRASGKKIIVKLRSSSQSDVMVLPGDSVHAHRRIGIAD